VFYLLTLLLKQRNFPYTKTLATRQMKNRITLLLSIFLTFNIFCQTDEPKSILASKFYSFETLALVVRFDKGIDSINFPIDTKLIKIQKKD
jgi:hypothetical protein